MASDFPLEEWDFVNQDMDFNLNLHPSPQKTPPIIPNLGELDPYHTFHPSSSTATTKIRHRRFRTWKSIGFLALNIRGYPKPIRIQDGHQFFDLKSTALEEDLEENATKAKRMKIQKKTKGKAVLEFGLSDEEGHNQEA